jgi:hypothetical protein
MVARTFPTGNRSGGVPTGALATPRRDPAGGQDRRPSTGCVAPLRRIGLARIVIFPGSGPGRRDGAPGLLRTGMRVGRPAPSVFLVLTGPDCRPAMP